MSLKDDLIAAKALIDSPEKWTKGTYRDEAGCMCPIGAVAKAMGVEYSVTPPNLGSVERLLNDIAASVSDAPTVVAFNDRVTTTHADIMALFNRAIEAAQ
jgi:hypothetical protein